MKIWAYTEGESEANMLIWLIRRYPEKAEIIRDLSKFIQINVGKLLVYIHNSRSIDKIPCDIQDNFYLTEHCSQVIVVGDLENLPCPQQRKRIMLSKIGEAKNDFKFIFSIPCIEKIYCDEKKVTYKVIKKLYKEKYGNPLGLSFENLILSSEDSPKTSIKEAMRKLGVKYKETEFSEIFFSQLSYQDSQNKTIRRLYVFFEDLLATV